MAFGSFTDEQDQLRSAVRGYFTDKSPESEVRRLMATDTGYDPAVWQQMARELGLQGLALPEQYGGQGAGWTELGIVLEEMGRALDFAAVALAAEQAGGAQAALDMSVNYLQTRVQFGQVIGAFQALKHMAADVLIEVESAKSAAYYALAAAAEDNEELPAAASLAQAYCTEAFVTAAHQNIQFHGGMGFTWEASPHLYFKRARSSEVFLGDASTHRRALAQRIRI
jgi:alkylation response protein AidB-like acyl-CoA dehydrogenase